MESYLWSSQVAHRFIYQFRWARDVSVLLSSCRIRSYNSLQNEVTWVGVPTKTTHLFVGDHNVCSFWHVLPSNSCNWPSCVSNWAKKPVISYKKLIISWFFVEWFHKWDIWPFNRTCVSTGMEQDICSIFRILGHQQEMYPQSDSPPHRCYLTPPNDWNCEGKDNNLPLADLKFRDSSPIFFFKVGGWG